MDREKLMKIQNDLLNKPKAILAAARRGSLPDLVGLSNFWPETTRVIRPVEALDTFLLHLKKNQVPQASGGLEVVFGATANRAFQSLVGISKADPSVRANQPLTAFLLDAWSDIHAWSFYLFKTRIDHLDKTDLRRKNTIYMLSAAWYTLSCHGPLRHVMVGTPRTLEIATRLWFEEEDTSTVSQTNSPMGTCLMYSLLEDATFDSLQRVHKAVRKKASLVAKFAIGNIRKALVSPHFNGAHLTIHLELINRISRYSKHPFRNALLSTNAIWVVTSVLVKLGNAMNSSDDLSLVDAMVSSFIYLYNCLETTDGFTWVNQAIGAGLLQAFCDCSPKFGMTHKEDLDMILSIFDTILPRYLVYRSVLESIDHSMKKIDCDPHWKRIAGSIAKKTWLDFRTLAEERLVVTWKAEVLKDARLTCDNVKCQRVGTKEDMRACSACLHTYYCSKECQAAAWKEGDHKTMCKMKQQERSEGKSEAISKKDAKFFHDLTLRDAIKHLPHLRGLAKKEYPNLTYHDVVVKIDYTVNPPTYKLTPLTGYNTGQTMGTANAEARNDALIEKVQENREKYTLLESLIAAGQGRTCVLTLGTGEFWVADKGLIGGGLVEGENDDGEELGPGTALDDVDMFRARRVLNSFLKNLGEKPAF